MSAIQAIGGGFALDRYGLRDDSPFVAAATDLTADREAMPLLLVADPVEPVPGAGEIAEDILHGMVVFLRHTMDRDITNALITAFKTANERVYAENRQRNGLRRIFLGLSCVVLRGNELFVAQCAPSQVLVWQDRQLHAIPPLDTWAATQISETFSELSYPLGLHTTIQPRISYSRCEPGDIVSVVSWSIARQLLGVRDLSDVSSVRDLLNVVARPIQPDGALSLHGAVYEISPVVTGEASLGSARGNLRNTMKLHNLPLDGWTNPGESIDINPSARVHDWRLRRDDDVYSREHLPRSSGIPARNFDTLGAGESGYQGTADLPDIRTHVRGAADDIFSFDLSSSPARFTQPSASISADPVHDSRHQPRNETADSRRRRARRPPKRKGHLVEVFAGLLLSLSAAVVGVWHVTKRDRPIHGPRDDGTLGLPHLQRWSDSYHPPRFDRIRSVAPRFQLNGVAMAVVALTVVVLAATLIYSQISGRIDERSAGIEAQLQDIAAIRSEAESATNIESAYESLVRSQAVLGDLEAEASSDDVLARVHEEQAAVEQALDTLTSMERLTSFQSMGSIPASPDGVTPRLFEGNGKVFIFGGGLFELDRTTGSLVHLLREGDLVGGSPVGTLLAASWNDDRPIAVDAHNAYMLEPSTGIWHRVPLGASSTGGHSGIAAVAAFDRNIYYLTPESGQILKFDALEFGDSPEDWSAGASKEELRQAVDLVVDGRIHVALQNGGVLTFYRSGLETTVTADVSPALDSVSALSMTSDGEYFVLVNQSDGRIVCIDREGNVVKQFVPADGAPSLAGATDLVINSESGISHVLVGDTLFAVRLTLAD